jgi:hypothetical protein
LLCCGGEHHVFRTVVLSIVLILAIAPTARLACLAWCHAADATTSACQHQDATTSSRVIGENGCHTAPAGVTALVREELRRGSTMVDAPQAIVVPRFQVTPRPLDGVRADEAAASPFAEAVPRLVTLRI